MLGCSVQLVVVYCNLFGILVSVDTRDTKKSIDHAELELLLGRLVRAMGLLEPELGRLGIRASASEMFALAWLAEAGRLSQKGLGDRLGLEKSTVSRLVTGMGGRGWVEREGDPGDARSHLLSLTNEGRAAAERLAWARRESHDRILAQLDTREQRALTEGLPALLRAMEGDAEAH